MASSTRVRFGLSITLCATLSSCSYPFFGSPQDGVRYDQERQMERGEEALEQGDLQTAQHDFDEAGSVNELPRAAPRWFRLGKAYVATGEEWAKPLAIQSFNRARAADPKLPGVRFELARFALLDNDFNLASRLLRKEIDLAPNKDASALLSKIEEHLRRERQIAIEASRQEAAEKAREEARYARAKQERLRRKGLLQAQIHSLGNISCKVVDYDEIGDTLGNDIVATTAAGTYVALLLLCESSANKTVYFPASAFALVGSNGGIYNIDTTASFYFAVTKQEEDVANPEALQLHPGLARYVGLMFDVPSEIVDDERTHLAFGKNTYQLVFPSQIQE